MFADVKLFSVLMKSLLFCSLTAALTKFEGTQVRFALLLVHCNKLDVQHQTPLVSFNIFYKLTSSNCCTAVSEAGMSVNAAKPIFYGLPEGSGERSLVI